MTYNYKDPSPLNYLEDNHHLSSGGDSLIQANAQLALVNEKLERSYTDLFDRLATIAEYRDDDTGKHTERVGVLSARISIRLGLDNNFINTIVKAARLHDIGKMAIPDSILLKPGALTEEEYIVMQQHCELGENLLSNSESTVIQMAQTIALSHHEKIDGSGYPHRLVGDNIPLEARIVAVAVADVYDALCHKRVYKDPWTHDDAIELLVFKQGKHFDSDVIVAFLDVFQVKSVAGCFC